MKRLNGIGNWVLAACVLAVTGVAVMHRDPDGDALTDAGAAVVTEDRPIGAGVTSVVLDGPINLTLRQGAKPYLAVRAEARLLPNIGTAVDGPALRIAPRGMLLRPRQPIDVTLTLPALTALRVGGSGATTMTGFGGPRIVLALDGSGNLRAEGRYATAAITLHGSGALAYAGGAADSIALDAVGSSDATLSGTVRDLHATLVGAGRVDAGALRADDLTVVQQGSGTGRFDARRSASVTLAGSGDVVVAGRPARRSVQRAGSGQVVFAEDQPAAGAAAAGDPAAGAAAAGSPARASQARASAPAARPPAKHAVSR
jgi:hypothetical protein